MTYTAYIYIINYFAYINLVSKCFDECSYTKNKCEYLDNIILITANLNTFENVDGIAIHIMYIMYKNLGTYLYIGIIHIYCTKCAC